MTQLEMQASPTSRKIIGVIVSSFLVTFALSRLIVYLVLGRWMPDLFLTIRGVHIHHFTYGVVILVIVGLYLLLKRPKPDSRTFLFAIMFYGIGLGLTFDEFGMWVRLQDDYWVRQSYDAVIIVVLLLLNIAFFKTITRLIYRELKHFGRLFYWLIKK